MIYIIGIGPGELEQMTPKARMAIENSDVIAGYGLYVSLIEELIEGKERIESPMMKEVDRCKAAAMAVKEGKTVSMISSGDAGIYGMASLMIEILDECDVKTDIKVIAGITAASGAAAVLGAPLSHDFACISLSDLLTPWEKIEKRLYNAADAGLIIALYNPGSKKRADVLQKACDILLSVLDKNTLCGIVRNIGRDGEEKRILTLETLRDTTVDMFTTVVIGNSSTKEILGHLVTPRGYRIDG